MSLKGSSVLTEADDKCSANTEPVEPPLCFKSLQKWLAVTLERKIILLEGLGHRRIKGVYTSVARSRTGHNHHAPSIHDPNECNRIHRSRYHQQPLPSMSQPCPAITALSSQTPKTITTCPTSHIIASTSSEVPLSETWRPTLFFVDGGVALGGKEELLSEDDYEEAMAIPFIQNRITSLSAPFNSTPTLRRHLDEEA